MNNYKELSEDQKRQFARNMVQRRKAYERWLKDEEIDAHKDILLVGDRPGPKAPQTDDYHNTPFYSKTYSGGWLNTTLTVANIPEDRLFWVNAYTWDNKETDSKILRCSWKHIFALGNNASNWCNKHGYAHLKVMHPQAHRRWNSKAPYDLIAHLLILHTT